MSFGRSLRGNVDRNADEYLIDLNATRVVPYVGTWIEMEVPCSGIAHSRVVPYVGTWIEIYSGLLQFLSR